MTAIAHYETQLICIRQVVRQAASIKNDLIVLVILNLKDNQTTALLG